MLVFQHLRAPAGASGAANMAAVISPAYRIGDNGKLYGGFDLDYVAAMRKLIRRADIILPNVTEACFLTETEYRQDYEDRKSVV